MQTYLEKKIVTGAGGGKGGGGGSRVAQEAPNTLRSRAIAKFIDLLSEGEIGGLVDGDKSVFFNKVPAINEDGTSNFSGFEYKLLTGLADQPWIEGFDQITSEYSVALRVRADNAAEWVSNSNNIDALIVTVQLPALSTQDKTTGDMNGYFLSLAIDVRNLTAGGQWVEKISYDHIQGKNTSPYERSYKISLDGPGQYAVRVRRLTADHDEDVSIQDKLYFQRVTEVIDEKLTYANSAVVGISIDSEQFGTAIPSRAYEIYGMKCQYPSNYNPQTRQYTGFWDGTWSYGWCNNPAWVFRACATNTRYGAGIPEMYIDKWGLYDLARYSDELVPDGRGGMEPRFVFNGTMSSREEAYRILQGIASMMRAIVFYAAGSVIIRQDRPYRDEELKSFTKANVLGDFNYSSTAKKARHTAANVQYVNPDLGYEKDFVFYEKREAIARYGLNVLNVAAYGTTSPGQAYRLGKWAVLTDLLQTEAVQFAVGIEGSDVLPGDIVEIADPHMANADFGGRIVEILDNGSKVKLDREISFAGATAPEIHLTLHKGPRDDVPNPGGPAQDRPVVRELTHYSSGVASYDNDTKTITLTDPVPMDQVTSVVTPLVWVFSKDELKPRLFKVFDVTERNDDKGTSYKIAAVNFSAAKFLEMDENFRIEDDSNNNYSDIPKTNYCAPPSNLRVDYQSSFVAGVPSAGMEISWRGSPDKFLRGYEVSYRRAVDNWVDLELTTETSVSLKDIKPGPYLVVVRAVNKFGVKSRAIQYDTTVGGIGDNTNVLIQNFMTENGDLFFLGQDCNVQWTSVPLSTRAVGMAVSVMVHRPGVGEAINAVTIEALGGDPLLTISTQVGDALDVTVGGETYHVTHGVGQTSADVAFVLYQRILPSFTVTPIRNGNTVRLQFTGVSLAPEVAPESDPMFRRYVVNVMDPNPELSYPGNVIRTEYTTSPNYAYTYDKNLADNELRDGGPPRRSLKFGIAVEDVFGNVSDRMLFLVSNPAPVTTVPNISKDSTGFTLEFRPPTDSDFKGILVWLSTTPGVVTTDEFLVWQSAGNPVIRASPLTKYHVKYAFYDAFGKTNLDISGETEIETTSVEGDFQEAIDAAKAALEASLAALAATVAAADAALKAAQDNFDAALTAVTGDVDGLYDITDTHTLQIGNKAEQSALNAQVIRIDGHNSTIGTLQQQVVDLDAEKVSTVLFGTLKAEVEGARNGSANLSAQLSNMRQATTDGLLGKASAQELSNLAATVTGQGTNVSGLLTRMSTAEANIIGKASASDLTALNATVIGQGSSISGMSGRLTVVEADLSGKASASSVSTLSAEITDARGGFGNMSARLTNLASVAASATGVQATRIDGLNLTVGGINASLTEVSSLTADIVDDMVVVKAMKGVYIDNNGYIAGTETINNGVTASFRVLADNFEIAKPGGGARTVYNNGRWLCYDASNRLRVALGVNI